jgi:TPR repeat protein
LEKQARALKRKADDGDVAAMVEFGTVCWRGKGRVADGELAIEYWGIAAEAGSAEAMAKLGGLWARGEVFGQDLEEAAKWFRKGAELGHKHCQWEMAKALEAGIGVKEDKKEALNWYKLAGEGLLDPSIPAISWARRDYMRLAEIIRKEG